MSIRKITENTEISPDQYVCGKSKALHAICAPPRKVLRTGGERIYVANPHGEDEGEYFTRATALYLCDTIEEGEALLVISRENVGAIMTAESDITLASMVQINNLLTPE